MSISSLKSIKGWVFDLDGVLVDSEPLHMQAWVEALRRHQIELGPEWFQIGLGMVDFKFYERIAEAYNLDPQDHTYLEEKHETFRQMIQSGLPLVPGIEKLLERLRGNVLMAVATSSGRTFLDFVLHQKNWADLFQATFSRSEIDSPKPAPEVYLTACAGLGLSPAECLAVEDTPIGLQSARSAGLHTIAITTNFSREKLAAADLVIDRYDEVLAQLDGA